MTREDATEFSGALRDVFPALRFVSEEHWKPFVDWDAWRAELEEHERREKAGLPTRRILHRMRDPNGLPLQYWDNLGVVEETNFDCWLLPRDWVPIWGEFDDFGVRRIINPPNLAFFFRRGRFHCPSRNPRVEQVWFDDPPEPRDDNESLDLDGCQLYVRWNRYDEDAEAFATAVFRVLRKGCSDRFVQIDPASRRALSLSSWRNRRFALARGRAEAWALARRHNYLRATTPIKPASYRFAPADIFSAEELAWRREQYRAEDQARLAEIKRSSNKGSAKVGHKN